MDSASRLEQADAVRRLWEKDPSLFSDDPAVQALVANRLGWLGLAEQAVPVIAQADSLGWPREDVRAERLSDVILLGMGGSSLAPLTIREIVPANQAAPALTVLDTSSPAAVEYALTSLDPSSTGFIVASKSGGTIEPRSLYAVFRAWLEESMDAETAGRRFVATTDSGSSLEELARDEGFHAAISTPVDVGGRYSALTAFGLLPAALTGVDVSRIAGSGAAMEKACRLPVAENPGAQLATWMNDGYEDGRDKLTLVASEGLGAFGLWVEQLIAESTGKHGKGIVPVIESGPDGADAFGDDRMVAVIRWRSDAALASWAEDLAGRMPVKELVLDDPHDVGAEFVRWEIATALIGHLLGINPFDEPNVTEAKEATASILAGELTVPEPSFTLDDVEVTYPSGNAPAAPADLSSVLRDVLSWLRDDDYLAILVFVPGDEAYTRPLTKAVDRLSRGTGRPVALGIGPRYLHSTGQLHKGGPNRGVYVVVSARGGRDVPVPGQDFTMLDLIRAQADGDMLTLAAHDRRVVGLTLPNARVASLSKLADAFSAALEQ